MNMFVLEHEKKHCKNPNSTGLIELIVQMHNYPAIALYTQVRMCHINKCTYTPNENEMCMKTTSFKRTKSLLEKVQLSETYPNIFKSFSSKHYNYS